MWGSRFGFQVLGNPKPQPETPGFGLWGFGHPEEALGQEPGFLEQNWAVAQ